MIVVSDATPIIALLKGMLDLSQKLHYTVVVPEVLY